MLMLANANRLKQEKLLEATAITLTTVVTVSTSCICFSSRYNITSSFSTSLSKSSRTVTCLERAPSRRSAQQEQKRQMLAREERLRREICCRFFILRLAGGNCEGSKWADEVGGLEREFSLLAKSRLNQLNPRWSALVEGGTK